MSCCDGWDYSEIGVIMSECPECGGEITEEGYAVYGCNYSPVVCDTCGSAPCDQSC